MKTHLDCIPCFLRQSLEAARHVTNDHGVHEQIVRDVLRMTAELDLSLSPPLTGQVIHRRLRELTGEKDPYRVVKSRFNRLAMMMLPELIADLKKTPDPLVTAAKFAIVANVIDLGVIGAVSEAQVLSALRESSRQSFCGDWSEFRDEVAVAKSILYLADNAGEIAIDRLLIQELGPERVTLAVRGSAVINDATLADAREVGMHDLVEVISNGSDAPGTVLDDCSDSFRERFRQADMIVAKGQGNFETLSEIDGNIFFLFKVKCPLIADHVGLPLGTHALLSAKQPIPGTMAVTSIGN
ncbi:MAG: DUF89 family protein [Proteobacteria bacterium]|nr:DUF89 family protein [Pseudomonadota bacterium]